MFCETWSSYVGGADASVAVCVPSLSETQLLEYPEESAPYTPAKLKT